ncbi:TonB-dependent receptor [Acidovorax sp. CCYZU-2555]|uniref:TonB-dependent siderophore receptor n=1 Tax=Acidovorax sp. CCYZU-2555 TaxID=2835042 RepID=UPI001BCF9ACE|nr:TonB-dependent receptor [Acidovorax sp. CCYZU-2555]MBS7779773.1 TonB-dependent siderophore receptor [Acidovorax sp. CCYZU-2555]
MPGCHSLPNHEISRLTPLALAAALALGVSLHTGAVAQTTPPAQQRTAFDIPAGPLTPALNRFAQRLGVTLAFEPTLAEGKTTQGVRGSHSIQSGFADLLAGTGLKASMTAPGVYTLRSDAADTVTPPVPAAPSDYTLREVRVAARRLGETEGSASYTSDAITVGKTAQAMREMPQSVSVITKQRLEDQNITDLGAAADQAVGITVQDQNTRLPNIYSRGFLIDSIQLDGGSPMFTGHYANVAYDMAEYDRVELLRGAAGLLNGTGNPGGAINLVRKMPTATPQYSFTASAGRWSNYRTEFDASGPLAFDGKLRGRAVVAYENRDYFVDRRSVEKPLFYGVLEADLGPAATLALGAREQRIHENGTTSWLPRYSNGGDLRLPRNTGLTTDWSFLDGTSKEVFAKLTWRLADRWTLRANATQARQQGLAYGAFGFGAVDPLTGKGHTWGGTPQWYQNKQNMIDVNVSGAFDLLGRTHEVLFGVDAQDITSRWKGSTFSPDVGLPVDLFNLDPGLWARPTANDWVRDYNPNQQRQVGAYGTLRLEVADGTKLIVGARVNRFKYDQQYMTRTNGSGDFDASAPWALAAATQYKEPTKVTPFAGIVHDINANWSAYASYAEIFKPQANLKAGPAPGTGLKPARGSNTEIGVKGELLDGKLNTAFALYRIEQEGNGIADPRYPTETILYAGSCCYLASGKVISQGLDAEVNGEIARGVNIYAGYTYNNNRNKTTNAVLSSITPKHSVKLWGTWQLPGDASAWKLGAGATVQSTQYVSGTASTRNAATGLYNGPSVPFRYTQGGYTVWNMSVAYQIDPQWSLTLNVNNVFDKWYYRTVGSSASGNYYGEPRNAMLTLRGKF